MITDPAPKAVSIDKAISDNASAEEPEAEFFLRGITDQLKWQELISKWLAFEKDHPIKGVLLVFFILASFCANVVVSRTYPLRAARRKLHGG